MKLFCANTQVVVTKYIRLRFSMKFGANELCVLAIITDANTGLDRPFGFNNIEYYNTLEDCILYKNCIHIADNKRKKMDAKVHQAVKELFVGLTSFEAIEVSTKFHLSQNEKK